MQHIAAGTDHLRHEKPGNKPGAKPQQVRRFAVYGPTDTKTNLQRKPKTKNVYCGFDEEPSPREHRPATLFLQFEYCQLADLATPLPVLAKYGAKRAQLITLSCADTNMAIVPQLLCHGRNPKETAQLRSCLNTSAESSCPYRLEDSQRTCR